MSGPRLPGGKWERVLCTRTSDLGPGAELIPTALNAWCSENQESLWVCVKQETSATRMSMYLGG